MYVGKSDIRAVIFDMDGTLLDSMPEWKHTAEIITERYGITIDNDIYEKFMKSSASDVAAYLNERFSTEITASDINAEIYDAYRHRIQPKPHVPELLDFLKDSGVKMAAATASAKKLAEAVFSRTGILPYLKGIISCEDIGIGKSKPDVYYKAMGLLRTKKENTAVIEDAYYAVCTAKNAGFYVIGIKDASMNIDEVKIRKTADIYIEDAAELYERICRV